MEGLKALFALLGWVAGLAAPLASLAVFGVTADIWLAVDSLAALLGVALLAAVAYAVCDIAANVRRLAADVSPTSSSSTPDSPRDPLDANKRHKDAVDNAAEHALENALENLRRNRQKST